MFPTPAGIQHNDGMTLRDYFASAASEEDIQEFMPRIQKAATIFYEDYGFLPCRQWARYCHADAMLKAREAKP